MQWRMQRFEGEGKQGDARPLGCAACVRKRAMLYRRSVTGLYLVAVEKKRGWHLTSDLF